MEKNDILRVTISLYKEDDFAMEYYIRIKFAILMSLILIAGISQGLTIPLLSLLLEKKGVETYLNSLNATSMYVGAIFIMLFAERLLFRFGYKPLILAGLATVAVSTASFPVVHLNVWFINRLLIGMGDSLLHFTVQTWITAMSSNHHQGRNLSIYGLMYALGFGIGPLGINLLTYGEWVPFITLSIILFFFMLLSLTLSNELVPVQKESFDYFTHIRILSIIWVPLMAPLLYGMMEGCLNVSFPIYAAKIGISNGWISLILPAFVFGSLIFQVPIGILCDWIGAKKILLICAVFGGITFFLIPLVADQPLLIMVLFAIAGIFLGSFYSVGLASIAGILPLSLLPAGNTLASINFDLGSLFGPIISGVIMEIISNQALFYLLGGSLILFAGVQLFYGGYRQELNPRIKGNSLDSKQESF